MKLKQRIKQAYRALRNKSANNDFLDFLGVRNVPVNALSEATYFACLKVLSEAIGKLPLKLLQYNDRNGVATAREHPLYSILRNRPNP